MIAKNSGYPETGPIKNNNYYSSIIFFFTFIFFGQLLLLNVILAVMMYTYKSIMEAQLRTRKLNSLQRTWLKIQNKILHIDNFDIIEESYFKKESKNLKNLMKNGFVNVFIAFLIILNFYFNSMIVQGNYSADFLLYKRLTVIFNSIFLTESFIRLFTKNKLVRAFPVLTEILISIISIFCAELIYSYNGDVHKLVYLGSVLSCLRILRILGFFTGVMKLIRTLNYAIPNIFPILCVLVILIYIYLVFGHYLFKDITLNIENSNVYSFKDFLKCFHLIMKMLTGDDWSMFMIELSRNSTIRFLPYIYFFSFIVIVNIGTINILILTFVSCFEDYYLNSNNPLLRFEDDLKLIKKKWKKMTRPWNYRKMPANRLMEFFRKFDKPLGFRQDKNFEEVFYEIIKMQIIVQDDFVYFKNLLHAILKRAYAEECFLNANEEQLDLLEKEERVYLIKMEKIQDREKIKTIGKRAKVIHKSNDEYISEASKKTVYNPFENYLYGKMCMLAWKNYTSIYETPEKNTKIEIHLKEELRSTLKLNLEETGNKRRGTMGKIKFMIHPRKNTHD